MRIRYWRRAEMTRVENKTPGLLGRMFLFGVLCALYADGARALRRVLLLEFHHVALLELGKHAIFTGGGVEEDVVLLCVFHPFWGDKTKPLLIILSCDRSLHTGIDQCVIRKGILPQMSNKILLIGYAAQLTRIGEKGKGGGGLAEKR